MLVDVELLRLLCRLVLEGGLASVPLLSLLQPLSHHTSLVRVLWRDCRYERRAKNYPEQNNA